MLDRTEKRFGIRPDWLAADTAYGSSDNLGWLVKKRGIIPFIPVIDHSNRKDGCFRRFTYAAQSAAAASRKDRTDLKTLLSGCPKAFPVYVEAYPASQK